MIKLSEKPTIFCDVDDTLIMWNPPKDLHSQCVKLNTGGYYVFCYPHKPHIELLKEFKSRGHIIVVWSAGGADWAETVVKKLQLESIVDLVVSKPTWYIDDLPSELFMDKNSRIWKDPYNETKKIIKVSNDRDSKVHSKDEE